MKDSMKKQKIRRLIIFISALLFPITMNYLSPYIITEAAMTSVINGSFIMFSFQLLFSIFFGRLFCGWACPGAGFGEIAGYVNSKQPKLGKLKLIKYVIWLIWLGTIIFLYIRSGGIKKIDPLMYTENGVSVNKPKMFILYYFVVFFLFGLPLIFGRRAFCHYICWMAPFMNTGLFLRKLLHLPGLYLKTEKSKCINCKLCSKNCVMGLDVNKMVQTEKIDIGECCLCGACIDSCPKNAINFAFGIKKTPLKK